MLVLPSEKDSLGSSASIKLTGVATQHDYLGWRSNTNDSSTWQQWSCGHLRTRLFAAPLSPRRQRPGVVDQMLTNRRLAVITPFGLATCITLPPRCWQWVIA